MTRNILTYCALSALFIAIVVFSHYASTFSSHIPEGTPEIPIIDKTATITFVGDIMLDRRIRVAAHERGYDALFAPLTKQLQESDIVIGNLEGPVTIHTSLSMGTEPGEPGNTTFTFPPHALATLAKNNIRALNIGNNHILDFGNSGLQETYGYLTQYDIGYFGAPIAAPSTLLLELGHKGYKKIGLVNFNQFIHANTEQTRNEIQALTKVADIVIVYAHWGDEYKKHPTDTQRALAHSFIDTGADAVLGSHPHVIQDKEIYKGKPIYYSLGNFIFDQYWNSDVRCGALVTFHIDNNNKLSVQKEHFVELQKNGSTKLESCAATIPLLKEQESNPDHAQ